MTTGIRKAGEFCWINMLTPQPAEAREFFGTLLGWTYTEMPGMGHAVLVGGRHIGGLFDLEGPNTPKGLTPHIGVMIKVESADVGGERVRALGGEAKPAFDIMNRGRMACCTDPNGAQFDVWEPKTMHGTDVDGRVHGAPTWFETITSDVDRATRFYSELFGWTPEVKTMPEFAYTTFKLGTDYVAGLMPILARMGKVPSVWATYFTVNNADETAALAAKLGAKLCVPPCDIPGVGRFCGLTSPQGVVFFALEYAS
jgi:predicted enzyme related to lactoylglutathione lyase